VAQVFIHIDCYAADYYDAKETHADIEGALDGFRGAVTIPGTSPEEIIDIGGISLQNDFDLLDQETEPYIVRNTGTYLVTYDQ
jgi:hypothetical protein